MDDGEIAAEQFDGNRSIACFPRSLRQKATGDERDHSYVFFDDVEKLNRPHRFFASFFCAFALHYLPLRIERAIASIDRRTVRTKNGVNLCCDKINRLTGLRISV